jgi:hypothetical protein
MHPDARLWRSTCGGGSAATVGGTRHSDEGIDVAGQHGDDSGGKGEDGLPGQPWQPQDPGPDSPAPPGDGDHRKDDKK